ncbi:MAG TPA: methylated-DNA--[protein]-cysteine S-methyltransferase [Frankiaceae bacterium]|jgi:methylated-DNA-[protein]-cysteine S-methyltransferase|nr:methylated-DNA--[protein]-cysteine S-methyltransferase [Frankiaceae bacterium]
MISDSPSSTRFTMAAGPFGELLVATEDGEALSRVWLPPAHPEPGWIRDDELPVLAFARRQLAEYFSGERTDFDLPLAARGTPFQHKVWDALRRIDYGTTRSYGQIADEIGAPGAARAVGAANHDNPLAIVVPCHRVVGVNGSLVGYAGGLDQKRTLLELETTGARLPL